jgi:membrane protease YdiL (CAAX protease family)
LGCGGIYAETFALWMALFFVGNEVAARLPRPSQPLGWGIALMLGSLVVLLYPLLRGVSWGQLRRDIGLTLGDGPARSVLYGLGTYLAALPIVLLSLLLLNALLIYLRRLTGQAEPFGPGSTPFHPVVEVLLRGSTWQRALMVLAAVVVAPLVEETLFRGLLYRHLRQASARLSATSSVLFSGILSGLIFALIHPQGLLAVPLLTTLALAFALVREWRGNLLPAMVAHGINNGVLTLAVIGMAG